MNIIKTLDFTVDNLAYQIRAMMQLDGVEVQAYQENKPLAQFYSDFADWKNSGDLSHLHNINTIKDMMAGMKSHIIEYHKRKQTSVV